MTVTFHFSNTVNVSCQVGDTAYWCPTTTVANYETATQGDIIEIGRIIIVTLTSITVETDLFLNQLPTADEDYIFFSTDNKVNLSSLLGYYASVKFKNDSKEEAEIFQTTAEAFQSSK